ncbi:DUF6484 domain-containing protein [Rhodobacteraceae bacterium D3-12]|nr:DUF6484 domain-containing protein [Rhodobacteraceae bacterium D3-12]
MDVKDRTTGVVIGMLMGFDGNEPLVVYPTNPSDEARPARALCALSAEDAGHEVALLFEDGDFARPLIIGRIVDPARQDVVLPDAGMATVVRDGETVKITGEERIELRVGKSVIIMEKDGHITIRGKHLVSHASASNRIRGGSVNLN